MDKSNNSVFNLQVFLAKINHEILHQALETLRNMLPITTIVTDEIIHKADRRDPENCIGYHTLKPHLPKVLQEYLQWGTHWGRLHDKETNTTFFKFSSCTAGPTTLIDMMQAGRNRAITFYKYGR